MASEKLNLEKNGDTRPTQPVVVDQGVFPVNHGGDAELKTESLRMFDEDHELPFRGTTVSLDSALPEVDGSVPKFGIVCRGGLKFIVDKTTGEKVSNGYHDIEVYRRQATENHPEFITLLGRTGAEKRALSLTQDEDHKTFQESPEGFHEIEIRADLGDLILFKKGALRYVADPSTGRIMSEGFHEYTIKNGILYGKTGAEVKKVGINVNTPQSTFLLEE